MPLRARLLRDQPRDLRVVPQGGIAKNNYYPGWHQQVSVTELLMNKAEWGKLSEQRKQILQVALNDAVIHTYVETEAKNPPVMQEMKDKHKVPTGGGPTRISRCSGRGGSRCWRRRAPRTPCSERPGRTGTLRTPGAGPQSHYGPGTPSFLRDFSGLDWRITLIDRIPRVASTGSHGSPEERADGSAGPVGVARVPWLARVRRSPPSCDFAARGARLPSPRSRSFLTSRFPSLDGRTP